MDGPNPKFIFQGLILLIGVVLFAAAIIFLKVRSGRNFRVILRDYKLQRLSLASAFVLVIVLFLVLMLINNM
jgi:hypothetical protein